MCSAVAFLTQRRSERGSCAEGAASPGASPRPYRGLGVLRLLPAGTGVVGRSLCGAQLL